MPAELAEYFPDFAEAMAYRRLRHDPESGEADQLGGELASTPRSARHIDPADLERGWPMTKVLRDGVGVRISRITDTVEARLADPETAKLLDVPLLSPILHYTGVTYDERRPGRGRRPHPLPRRPLLLLRHRRGAVKPTRPDVRP